MSINQCRSNCTKKKETKRKNSFALLESPKTRPLIYHAIGEPHLPIVCIIAVQPQANEYLIISCQQRPPCSMVSNIFAASHVCALLAQMCDNVYDLRSKHETILLANGLQKTLIESI